MGVKKSDDLIQALHARFEKIGIVVHITPREVFAVC